MVVCQRNKHGRQRVCGRTDNMMPKRYHCHLSHKSDYTASRGCVRQRFCSFPHVPSLSLAKVILCLPGHHFTRKLRLYFHLTHQTEFSKFVAGSRDGKCCHDGEVVMDQTWYPKFHFNILSSYVVTNTQYLLELIARHKNFQHSYIYWNMWVQVHEGLLWLASRNVNFATTLRWQLRTAEKIEKKNLLNCWHWFQ